MTKEELENKISMALKGPILQIGFEIICKNLSELEKEAEEQLKKRRSKNDRKRIKRNNEKRLG